MHGIVLCKDVRDMLNPNYKYGSARNRKATLREALYIEQLRPRLLFTGMRSVPCMAAAATHPRGTGTSGFRNASSTTPLRGAKSLHVRRVTMPPACCWGADMLLRSRDTTSLRIDRKLHRPLSSLLTLSQSILNTTTFFTQRRNAREATRQVSLLLIFLQDLHASLLPNDAVPSLSDLHFSFQNLHFLLQDCSREGARLFMLLKSRHVASQLRSLFRTIAATLDALPLHVIKVCWEVRELVELVRKQARKVTFELDPEDQTEAQRVNSVLQQFERGIEPDLNAMKRTLTYLEIKTWIDCNREVKFLEDVMLSSASSVSDEEEVSLLSGLISFLCYCRGVIFEDVDFPSLHENSQSEGRSSGGSEELSCEKRPPEDFRCPISLELMIDPVTTSTGQTYDRISIQKWLKAGNRVCPKSGERLTNTELVPNTSLKRLIQQFCVDNGISVAKPSNRSHHRTGVSAEAGSPAAAHAVQFLCWFLARKLAFGTEEQQNKAAYEVRLLARSNVFNRTCLVEVGTVPPLIDLLSTGDRTVQENAVAALLKLSKHSSGQQCIMESRGLAPILKVLNRGLSLEARQMAAATIFYLCSVKEFRKIIGDNPEGIPGLVEMIKEERKTIHSCFAGKDRLHRSEDAIMCGKKNAVVAIFGLLLHPQNHSKVLAAGAVPAIVRVLSSSLDKAGLVTDCLAVLAALAETTEGARAVLEAEALHLIIWILKSETSRVAKEHCVSILMSLCVHGGSGVVAFLVAESSIMPLLYWIITDGTPHAAKKARSLIRVLQEFNEQRTSGLVGSSSVLRQPLIHMS
ncbi:U-box domain-containing protein 18-like [Arachis ipaensis]|uniref:U-box domain-containing protein 18-like n=1 Tax=Arachis ipaensis TaxID=130454 RepID=UPI000A2B6AC7|nr:U-box domain-containing protein 18-like [Arachis ipaensis]